MGKLLPMWVNHTDHGFAHSMTSAALEYRKEGFVTGVGSNIFKLAGTVILYGVVSAWFFGLLRLLIMGG